MFLIDDLLLSPITGLKFVLNQLQKVADLELNDESFIKERLIELQMRLEVGEIAEDDFQRQESELFARLRVLRARSLDLIDQVNRPGSLSIEIETDVHQEDDFWRSDDR